VELREDRLEKWAMLIKGGINEIKTMKE